MSIVEQFRAFKQSTRSPAELWYYQHDNKKIHVVKIGKRFLLRMDCQGEVYEITIASFDDLETACAAYLLLPDVEYKEQRSNATAVVDEQEQP